MKLYHQLADYYYIIEEQHREIHDEISFIRSYFVGRHMTSLLDLGCGSGEHLNRLVRYGIDCTGIDSSNDMITTAQQRFPGKVTFIHQDIRSFDYYESFDVIICIYGTFNYLHTDDDISNTLWNTYRALKDDGIAIFEVWNAVPLEQIQTKKISPVSTAIHDDTTIRRERGFTLMDTPKKNMVEVNFKYHIRENGTEREVSDRHIMRIFRLEELRVFLQENGFNIRQVYSSYLKEPFTEHSSKIIIVADKS
jgi:SAM-dependent methyltransferase